MTSLSFNNLRSYLKTHSGYALDEGKEYVLESRWPIISRMTGCTETSALAKLLERDPHGRAGQLFIQAMTINETMFFRDGTPFENLEKNILPALMRDRAPGKISIWCTACSSGQEPYSVAMTIDKLKPLYPQWQFDILASDLSEDMIARCEKGVYSEFETSRGMTPEMRSRYFDKTAAGWQVTPELRSMVRFKPMNLFKVDAAIGPFDIILCRNVLIYFDVAQKAEVLNSLRRVTKTGGYLMAGAAEVLTGLSSGFKIHPEWKGVYSAV